MATRKTIKGFNVDLYNKKVAELDNAIKILNDFLIYVMRSMKCFI